MSPPKYVAPMRTDRQAEGDGVDGDGADGERPAVVGWCDQRPSGQGPHSPACRQGAGLRPAGGSAGGRGRTGRLCQCLPGRLAPQGAQEGTRTPALGALGTGRHRTGGQTVRAWRDGTVARWHPGAHRSDRSHTWLDRIDAHVVADAIAPHQNGMVAIMIPHIRFSDRPLTEVPMFIYAIMFSIVDLLLPVKDR